jgi:lipoyl(octanoyl) transferase
MSALEIIYLGTEVDYQSGWEIQRAIHADVVAGVRPDTLLLLEHTSVYTAGRRTELHERPLDGTPVIDVDRGGKITWHGPGQIVGYPIVKLPDPVDVIEHVRRIEKMLMTVCAELGVLTDSEHGGNFQWSLYV